MQYVGCMLAKYLTPRVEEAYTFLRVLAGLMFAFHGIQKLFGILTEFQPPPFSQVWFGGIIELVAGFAIAIGLFTRYAAFLASGMMAVAYLQFHWRFDFGERFFPDRNKGELALLYCALFFYFACNGPGRWSIDHQRRRTADARPSR
jgi:putative oxidoreductase